MLDCAYCWIVWCYSLWGKCNLLRISLKVGAIRVLRNFRHKIAVCCTTLAKWGVTHRFNALVRIIHDCIQIILLLLTICWRPHSWFNYYIITAIFLTWKFAAYPITVKSRSRIIKVFIDVNLTIEKSASDLSINNLNALGLRTIEVAVIISSSSKAIKNFIVN